MKPCTSVLVLIAFGMIAVASTYAAPGQQEYGECEEPVCIWKYSFLLYYKILIFIFKLY